MIADLPASNMFLSYVGHTVQFAVPDDQTPGAIVTGFDEDGTQWPEGGIIVADQEHTPPVVPTKENPRRNQMPICPRLMVRLARPWTRPGVYRFRVEQDSATTEYEYTVLVAPAAGNREDMARFEAEQRAWYAKAKAADATNDHSPDFEMKD